MPLNQPRDPKDIEIERLKSLINAYEKLAALEDQELRNANDAIGAHEIVEEIARQERLNMIAELEALHHFGESHELMNEIIKILKEDHINEEIITIKLEALRQKNDSGFYSDFFRVLAHLNLEEAEARKHWEGVLKNTKLFNERLGRSVGLRVAMLDYMINQNHLLKNPKIIEINIYENIIRNTITDELTGVYNKRYFEIMVLKELKRGLRYGRPFSIFLFDVDDFKNFNDTFGHQEGDNVLRIVGAILINTFRAEDTSFRIGGEEFAVILPELEVPFAMQAAKRFSDELSKRSESTLKRKITISGGVTGYPLHGDTMEILFEKADKALYYVKKNGKNSIIEYNEVIDL